MRNRLIQDNHLSEQRAEALVAAWEAEGDARDLEPMSPDFWRHGTSWIFEQLAEKA